MGRSKYVGYMYILLCSDETFYVGSTNDLVSRFKEHQSGYGSEYTSKRLPVYLVYFEGFNKVEDAFKREHQVKKWSKAKKNALINKDRYLLKKLATCQNLTHSRFKEFEGIIINYK